MDFGEMCRFRKKWMNFFSRLQCFFFAFLESSLSVLLVDDFLLGVVDVPFFQASSYLFGRMGLRPPKACRRSSSCRLCAPCCIASCRRMAAWTAS